MTTFVHRGKGTQVKPPNKKAYIVYECHKREFCTEQDHGRMHKGEPMAVCESCPLLDQCRIHENKPEPKKLTLAQRAASFVKTQAKSAITGLASLEVINERLAVCEACEHLTDSGCPLCGCIVNREQNRLNKLAHKSATCPANPPKWGAVE